MGPAPTLSSAETLWSTCPAEPIPESRYEVNEDGLTWQVGASISVSELERRAEEAEKRRGRGEDIWSVAAAWHEPEVVIVMRASVVPPLRAPRERRPSCRARRSRIRRVRRASCSRDGPDDGDGDPEPGEAGPPDDDELTDGTAT